jgi:hypothetical protein
LGVRFIRSLVGNAGLVDVLDHYLCPPFVSLTLSTILERGGDREEKGWEEVCGCEGGRQAGRQRGREARRQGELGAERETSAYSVPTRR